MNLIVLPASLHDAENIAPNLRKEDHAEIMAVTGKHAVEVLPLCVEAGRTWCAFPESSSQPVAILGVSTPNVPWMVATPQLLRYKRSLIDQSRTVLMQMHHIGGDYLHNYADERNTKHLQWLQWLGFSFTHLVPDYGVAKMRFWHFERNNPLCALP